MDDELKVFIKIIGSAVFSAILYALPILLTCSFAFSWDPMIKWLLVVANIILFMAVCGTIYMEVEEDDEE